MKIKYNKEDVVSHEGVAAVIKNTDGKVLMQKHIKYGFWTIPVGKVKENQAILDGLKQEIFEECGISIEKCRELVTRKYYYSRDENEVCVNSHLFEIINYSGIPENKEPNKHKQQVFLTLEEIKKLPYLSDLTLLYLETLLFKRKPRI